jgi:hypothetical protein
VIGDVITFDTDGDGQMDGYAIDADQDGEFEDSGSLDDVSGI